MWNGAVTAGRKKVRLILVFLVYIMAIGCVSFILSIDVVFDIGFWVKMLFGLLSLLMAILASLQAFLKYSEQAGNRSNASTRYQALFNEID
jgi:hypothetical protein